MTNNMTHILIYTDSNGYFGVEQNNHILGLALINAGFSVSMAQPFGQHRLIQERQAAGIEHHWIKPEGNDGEKPSCIIKSLAPDLVLFGDGSPFSNIEAKKTAASNDIPFVVVSYSADPQLSETHADKLADLSMIYSKAETVIGSSQAGLDLLNGKFGLPFDRGAVIYPGRPAEYFQEPDQANRQNVRDDLGLPNDHLLCLTVAPFKEGSGYQHLTDAISHLEKAGKLDRVHFLCIGEGEAEKFLNGKAGLQIDARKIHCLPPQPDIVPYLDAADLCIQPFEFAELPLILLEAMAKGLPVIATAVGGVSEIVDETGFLLPDPIWRPIGPVLANTIHWMDQSEQLRQELGSAGSKRAIQFFRAETMANNYLSLISMILNRLRAKANRDNKKAAPLGQSPAMQLEDQLRCDR